MTAFLSDEDIEDMICWNIGFGIAPHETIKDLQNEGIEVPEYLIEEYKKYEEEVYTHRNDHLI